MNTVKKMTCITMIALLTTFSCKAQSAEEKSITSTIENFAKAGDLYDVEKLADYLDPNYRIIMNQLFGSTETAILTRAVYLDKIMKKEFGGDDRKVTVSNIIINGNTASALVKFTGKQMISTNIVVLLKDKTGHWLLVSDLPVIQ